MEALPAAARAALDAPAPGERRVVPAAGIPFGSLAWGPADARPLLLLHGVNSSARNWWRLGPAFAAAGRRVVAVDLPGHGETGHWSGRHRFRETAADVAAFARAADLATDDLQVIGHSWGAMIAAALPAAGLPPATIVLLDPPVAPLATMAAMAADPDERRYATVAEALAVVRPKNPAWSDGDVLAKAESLVRLEEAASRAVLTRNGDWDGGWADLDDPAAAGIAVRVVRGDPAAGGLVPDAAALVFRARFGDDAVTTIAGGPHSPHRILSLETTAALLRALGSGPLAT